MLQLRVKIDTLSFNRRGFAFALDRAIKKAMLAGARAFLEVTYPRVPVYTGMARGSLFNLGRLVNVNIPINPTLDTKQLAAEKRRGRSIAHGKKLGTPSRKIIQKTKNTKGQVQWQFRFNSDVEHYRINEIYHVIPSGPWESFAAGRDAFFIAYRLSFVYPKLNKYVIKTTYTVTGNGGIRKQRTINNG